MRPIQVVLAVVLVPIGVILTIGVLRGIWADIQIGLRVWRIQRLRDRRDQ